MLAPTAGAEMGVFVSRFVTLFRRELTIAPRLLYAATLFPLTTVVPEMFELEFLVANAALSRPVFFAVKVFVLFTGGVLLTLGAVKKGISGPEAKLIKEFHTPLIAFPTLAVPAVPTVIALSLMMLLPTSAVCFI